MNRTTRTLRLTALLAATFLTLTGACGGDDDNTASGDGTTTTLGSSAMTADSMTVPTAPGSATAGVSIEVDKFLFTPKDATAKVGQTVTWTNSDDRDHAIFHDTDTFPELRGAHFGPTSSTKTFTQTFSKPGVFKYYCGIHNSMMGTITVT